MLYEHDHELIQTLNACAAACNNCISECLDEEEVTKLANCIRLDMDCAQLCTTVSALLSRGSAHGHHLLKECAEVCTLCADECEKHGKMGMEHCRICAEQCRKCAEACSAHAKQN